MTPAERQARYRARHPEKIAAYKASEAKRESDAKYRATRAERIRASSAKYKQGPKYLPLYIRTHLRRKYSMTVQEYNEMLSAQGGVCKICGLKCDRKYKDERRKTFPLCVDHDHKTGKVRGLLCNKCNVGLALFKENKMNLAKAISYLGEPS